MHPVITEFAAHLDASRARFAGRPREELTHLWLLALEREAIVTVAYRRDVIERRLAGMPVDHEVRRAVATAIRWAWRDEEMHTLWIRGALLREGSRSERVRAWLTQVQGAVGGWTSSRQAHFRWRDAPGRRLVAELLEVAGAASGNIPDAVRGELGFQSFSDFCRFNVAAETTAGMAWRRMAELAADPATSVSPIDAQAFASIAADEGRHARLFDLLQRSFRADDTLADGVSADGLLGALGAIGQRFLAEPRPGDAAWKNPLGKGGVVWVREGRRRDDLASRLHDVLEAAGLPALLDERRPHGRPVRVAIKATFMLCVRRDDPSPGVAVALLHALSAWLAERGAECALIEARNVYDAFHGGRTVPEVATWLGLDAPHHRIVDAQADQVPHAFLRGLGQEGLSATWRDADVRVVVGKLRSHPTSVAMLALEATEGLGARHDALLFGDRKAERETATLALLDGYPPDLALIDAWQDVPDGLLGMMGCRDPQDPLRLYASRDAVALDAVLARHIGARPDHDAMLLSAAFDWFGDPRSRTVVDGPDDPLPRWRSASHTARTALLSRLALPVYHHASARGALFVPPMDEGAFPPLEAPGPLLRAARAAIRAIVEPDADHPLPQGLLPAHFHDVGGHAVRIARSGAGPPVVLLHGYPDTLQIWSRLAPRLAVDHEVVALDWPGLGYSAPWPGPSDPAASASALLRILDALGLDRVRLVGADMGGQPALVAAAGHPDRIASVAVLNSLLFGDGDTSWEIAVMRRAGLGRAAFAMAPGLVYRQCLHTFLEPGEALPDALDADMLGAFLQRSNRRALARMTDGWQRALPGLPDAWWRIRCPVLALWAEHDHHFPPSQAERLASLLPEARVEVLPGARHWMAWSRPEQVEARLRAFWKEDRWTS